MTGKNPQQIGKNPLIHRESAGITMDHSSYCTVYTMTHRKKFITEKKNPFILSNCITNST